MPHGVRSTSILIVNNAFCTFGHSKSNGLQSPVGVVEGAGAGPHWLGGAKDVGET